MLTIINFDEQSFLTANLDVKSAIESNEIASVKKYIEQFGLESIKNGLRKFHNDFDVFNEVKYLETFFPSDKPSLAFEHFCTIGYSEIIQGQRPWIKSFNKDYQSKYTFYDKIFDEDYYLKCYPDIEKSNFIPLEHYLKHGWKEGRKPNRWFDPHFYLQTYEDVANSNVEPLEHYIKSGRLEKRLPKDLKKPLYRIDLPINYDIFCTQYNIVSIDIIIPVHNALADVQLCVESLYDTQTYAFNLIVVDDASDEETREYLEEQSIERGFQLIRHEENRRFTHSVNSGLAQSEADYTILLNSDTIVTKNWIEKIIACFESDNQIGVVGPLSNAASWQSVPQRSKPEGGWMVNDIPQGYSIEQMGLLIETLSKKSYPKVPSVNGFCYAIKRAVIEEIGNFDTEYFPTGYGEEDDYSIRAREAGYEIAIADDTYIYHSKSKSYTHQIREKLTANGRLALDKKHGKERIDILIQDWKADNAIIIISNTINNILQHSKGNKKVVYTAIFGPYDDLKKPEYINDDWDYVCFTDNKELKSDIYTIKYIEPLFENSTKNARMFKLLSHIFLVGYDYSLWVDGSVKIRGKNIDDLITDLNKKRQYLSIHSHIKRDCIYDEAMACILADKAHPAEVIKQVRHYKQESFPEKIGLVESAEILRNHKEEKTQQLNQAWWEVLDQFSIRDQLAFNYICWKHHFTYHKMAGHQWLDQYFHLYKHGIAEQEDDNLPTIAIALLLYSDNIEYIEKAINNIIDKTEYPNYTMTLIYLNEIDIKDDLQLIVDKYPDILHHTIADESNDTEAINRFISQSTQEYTCILSDKTYIITADWLKRLVYHIQENDKYMAVGPTILDKDYLISASSIRIKKFTEQKIEYSINKKIGGHGTVDAIPPIAILINRQLFQHSNKLNENYDLLTAWIKFCVESRQNGLQIRFDVDSEVVNLKKDDKINHIYF